MTVIARFVTRPNEERPCGWDLALMSTSEYSEPCSIKPGYVYELQEILGQVLVIEKGPSCMRSGFSACESGPPVCWGNSPDTILTRGNGSWHLTKEEYEDKND